MYKEFFYGLPYFIKAPVVNAYSFLFSIKRKRTGYFDKIYDYLDKRDLSLLWDSDNIYSIVEGNRYYQSYNSMDFFSWPLIDKQIALKNYSRIIDKAYLYEYLSTSGTTGRAFKYPASVDFIKNQWAVFWRFRYLHKISVSDWCACFTGKSINNKSFDNPPYWFESYFTKQLYFSQYHLNEYTVDLYVDKLIASGIRWLHGYPSNISYFALLVQSNDKLFNKVVDHGFKIITLSSEKLFSHQRQIIEKVFKCPVRQFYGQVEGVANIYECECGSLHVDEDFSLVEFFEDKKSGKYKIVGTNIYNKAFPLIRYDTGDMCVLYDADFICPCGVKSRIVKEIIGRNDDSIVTKDGVSIGRLSVLFYDSVNILDVQIIQRSDYFVEFFFVVSQLYSSKDEKHIKKKIESLLNIDYHIVYVDKLKKRLSGKYDFVISEVVS